MSFGAGMGAGIACGMSLGVATGINSGKQQALGKLRAHFQDQGLTVHDRYGKELPLQQVLEESSCGACESCSGVKFVAAGIALLGVLALGAVIAYWIAF